MKRELSTALREFISGPLNQLIVNLGGRDGDQWEQELKRFLRKEHCWIRGQVTEVMEPKPIASILELVSTLMVNATTSKFVAKEKFLINTKHTAPAKIVHLNDDFKAWFLAGEGKIEDPISEGQLRYGKLTKSSVDSSIIEMLGGEGKAETTLTEVFDLMSKQSDPQEREAGQHTSGRANIFYVQDSAGMLRAVCVRWHGVGWFVGATSCKQLFKWDRGDQVFSRNSVLEPLEPSTQAQA